MPQTPAPAATGMLAAAATTEENGKVYGFNLVYSGNHASYIEKSRRDIVRVAAGINPHCFEWTLEQGESFETPEAVMTFSSQGFNGMSRNMHSFVNEHIVRGHWQKRERPILINSWEAYYFVTRGNPSNWPRKPRNWDRTVCPR